MMEVGVSDGVPFLEPFSVIPAIAAITEKLEFSTSVYKLLLDKQSLQQNLLQHRL